MVRYKTNEVGRTVAGRIENDRSSSPRKWYVMGVNIRVSIGLELTDPFGRDGFRSRNLKKKKSKKIPHMIIQTASQLSVLVSRSLWKCCCRFKFDNHVAIV